MDPQYALIGWAAVFMLQLAGRFVAEQSHPWRDSFAGAVVFVIALLVGPVIGGALRVGLLVTAVVGLLLHATVRPGQWQALRRRRS